jgi:hypothetical protein
MPLKPWYKVVTPREDCREGMPLDAAEFAVHLKQVREGRAPDGYKGKDCAVSHGRRVSHLLQDECSLPKCPGIVSRKDP